MTFPDPGGYFRHLPGAVQSPIEFCELMPDRILVVDDEEGLSGIFTAKDLAYRVRPENVSS